jgi:acyl carrier protein
MIDKIEGIVIETLKELNEELKNPALDHPTSHTPLFGPQGSLDSLALVTLIRDVEEFISEEFEKDIILADERAMSQKLSPFRSVKALAGYIDRLLKEEV